MWSWKKWWQRRSETACKGNCGGERLESEAKKGNGRVRRGNQKRKGRTVRNRLLLPVLARALIRRTRLRLSPSSRARQAASEPVGRQPPPVRRRWGLEVVIAAVPLLQPHNHGDRADVAFPDGSLVQMHACRRAAAVAGVVCSPSCLFCIFFSRTRWAHQTPATEIPAWRGAGTKGCYRWPCFTQVQSQTTTAGRSRAWRSQTGEDALIYSSTEALFTLVYIW